MDWVLGVNKLLGRTDSMSEFEREEVESRTKAMTEAEMIVTASKLPDNILIGELVCRYLKALNKIDDMEAVFRTEPGTHSSLLGLP